MATEPQPAQRDPGSIPMAQVHLNAVMASKEAAQRDRDLFRRERDRYREALEQIAAEDVGNPFAFARDVLDA